jgi:hypothetical protein
VTLDPNLAPLFRQGKFKQPTLAPLFTEKILRTLQIDVTTVRYRWIHSDEHREYDYDTYSRAEVLRMSAGNALDFNLPTEKRGQKVFVDLRSLDPDPNSNAIMVIDSKFLPDLQRLKLRLKDGRVYAKTFRQTLGGVWKAHLVPLTSIVAAKKYRRSEWDATFLSARTLNRDSLDLRAANVHIPALEDSTNTRLMNEKFDKDTCNAGYRDGWLTNDEMNARAKKPKGAAPDSDGDVSMMTSKWHTPATDGQRTEGDSATSENLFLSERGMEPQNETDPGGDLGTDPGAETST